MVMMSSTNRQGPARTFDEALTVVGSTPHISLDRARELYEFVRRGHFRNCLELGFAHAASTVYIAAALEFNNAGHLTSVDLEAARDRIPPPTSLVDGAGLASRVTLVFEPISYNWFLHRTLRDQLRDGRIVPCYDFCYLDGAHTWVDDGFAFFLVDKLLTPGAWIIFDDLSWKFDHRWPSMRPEEKALAQVGEVFELLVTPHTGYIEIRNDGVWGYARKSPEEQLRTRTVVRVEKEGSNVRDLVAMVRRLARRFGR